MPGITLPYILLVLSCVVVSAASRAWRPNTVPWGTMVLFVAASCGLPVGVLLATAAVMVIIECWKRADALVESLLPLVVAGVGLAPRQAALGPSLIRLTLMFGASLGLVPLIRLVSPSPRRVRMGTWAEVASCLLLLASAVMVGSSLMLDLPLLGMLGLAVPMVLPAIFSENLENTRRGLRMEALADLARVFAIASKEGQPPGLQDLRNSLHTTLRPALGHEETVLALNPAFATTAASLAVAPRPEGGARRIRERARFLFQSGRATELTRARSTSPGELAHLDPAFTHQFLIPVKRDDHILALVGLLSNRSLDEVMAPDELARVVESFVLAGLCIMEQRRRLQFLEKNTEQQGRRLRRLLELNQLVATSPDISNLSTNLVRAVCVGFGVTWAGFLLRDEAEEGFRLAASAGDDPDWQMEEGAATTIQDETIRSALGLGSMVSQCHVIPLDRWPHTLPRPPGVEHLLAVPLCQNGDSFGYVLILPHPLAPMPDLEDLRALEILVDQITPFVVSGLQLEEINRKTLIDPLTGLANRRSLEPFMEQAILTARERTQPVSFAMLDMDDFKLVNDRFGHPVGDVVLRELADSLTENVRTKDFVARYGGEEFSIVLPGLSSEKATVVLDRLRISVANQVFAPNEITEGLRLTVSIGVATYPENGTTATDLLEAADMALYRAKRRGRNCVVASSNMPLPTQLDEPFAL